MGRESWFSTCAGCFHCLGSTESLEVCSLNWHSLLTWEPGLRRRGPSAHNIAYKASRVTTEKTLFHTLLETWDDPVRAAMLSDSPDYTLDPCAMKEPLQPMFGKEGLVDAWKMWEDRAPGVWDRESFALNHQKVGFYWSRAFPDTTRLRFSSRIAYNDLLVPGKKYRLDIAGQFIGRHDAAPLLRGRDKEGLKSTEEGV